MNKFDMLEKFIGKLKTYTLFLVIVEVICTLLIGIGASQVKDLYSSWTLLLILCSLIQICISIFHFGYIKDFPTALVDSLKSDLSSQQMNKDFSRISLINDTITKSLIKLNVQTCKLADQVDIKNSPSENKLCDSGIQQGLKDLNDSFLKNIHNIIDSFQTKFTIGIFINRFSKIPSEDSSEITDCFDSGSFLLRDDLNLDGSIMKDIYNKEGLSGLEFEIQTCIKTCFKNHRSEFFQELRSNNKLSMYTNVIPLVCDEDSSIGVMFIIGDSFKSIPNDFDEVVRIQNRIITNWIERYNECVMLKHISDISSGI